MRAKTSAASSTITMSPIPPALSPIDVSANTFKQPSKRINTHDDLPLFNASPAYKLITSFIVHLNSSVCPVDPTTGVVRDPVKYATDSTAIIVSPDVEKVIKLLQSLEQLIPSAPPETGPRRFGNVAFRKWYALVRENLGIGRENVPELSEYLPSAVLSIPNASYSASSEVLQYLIGSFGSPERLDYGTGHELSFAAFLCGIWVLGGFQPDRDEQALVLRCFNAYFHLVRRLVQTYNLEPAGSHGVWGLDDHSFLPYIFGSSQLTTYRPTTDTPGDDYGLPKPADVVKKDIVDRERPKNLYFDAIGFINDVKKGPFWEHSPILYDISGIQKGWGKVNEGMLKMYDKEVLGKFPVVQHFPFGSIFRWISNETGPGTTAGHPGVASTTMPPPASKIPMEATKAPWANASATTLKPGEQPVTKAPWAAPNPPPHPTSAGMNSQRPPPVAQLDAADTKAPWATENSRAGEQPENSQQPSEALLGPKRTSSPDAMLNPDVKEIRERRGSVSTGGVRVAETGDLSGRRPSQTS